MDEASFEHKNGNLARSPWSWSILSNLSFRGERTIVRRAKKCESEKAWNFQIHITKVMLCVQAGNTNESRLEAFLFIINKSVQSFIYYYYSFCLNFLINM